MYVCPSHNYIGGKGDAAIGEALKINSFENTLFFSSKLKIGFVSSEFPYCRFQWALFWEKGVKVKPEK
jgi:hypothetical protein